MALLHPGDRICAFPARTVILSEASLRAARRSWGSYCPFKLLRI